MQNNELTLLFTTGQQGFERCSKHTSHKCKCYNFFLNIIERRKKRRENPNSEDDNDDNDEDDDMDYEYEKNDCGEKLNHYNDRVKNYHKKFGYNESAILYPFRRDPIFQEKWAKKINGDFEYPDVFIPKFDENKVCIHNNKFEKDDDKLHVASQTVVIYLNMGEKVFEKKVMFRRTDDLKCRCQQHVDGNEWLLWHCGVGKMVCYTVLATFLHSWAHGGFPAYTQYKSIIHTAKSAGMNCSLTYEVIRMATGGFMRNLSLDLKRCFTCIVCGTSPSFFVMDGTQVGPKKSKVRHLSEFDRNEDDIQVLSQGATFKDYIFLSSKKERDEVLELISGDMSMDDFISSREINTDNGKKIQPIIRRVETDSPFRLPKAYKVFLEEISKPSPVVGIMQVAKEEILNVLTEFCEERLDIQAAENRQQIHLLRSEMPSFWDSLIKYVSMKRNIFFQRMSVML